MPKKKSTKKGSSRKGNWQVTFEDGTVIDAGYYPNPRMAVGAAMKQHKGKVESVRYV